MMGVAPKPTVGLIASDHFGWAGLRTALAAIGEWRVVDLPPLAPTVAGAMLGADPDLLLVAARLGPVPPAPAIASWQARCPRARLLLVGDLPSPEERLTLSGLRSHGYLLWGQISPDNIGAVVQLVLNHDLGVASLTAGVAWPAAQQPALASPAAELAPIELAVLLGLEQGSKQEAIARDSRCSERTVQRAVRRLKRRFKVQTTYQLALCARKLGLAGKVGIRGEELLSTG